MTHKAVVLLDVDGVLNVLGVDRESIRDRGLVTYDAVGPDGRTYRLHVDPQVRTWIAALSERFEIAWCTTWRHMANASISPLVGLPGNLDTVWLPTEWTDVPFRFCRKSPYVREWAAQRGVRRLAWIDDEVTAADEEALTGDFSATPASREWQRMLAETPPLTEVLLIGTDSDVGLTEEHVEALLGWAE